MRIGVFGGSFDPVHYGHLLLAEVCRDSLELDEVRLVPAAVAPHKQGQNLASDVARMEMLELAIAGHPAMRVWDVEIQRGGISYTVDTLTALRDEQPDDDLFLLMGADSLGDLPNWRLPEAICGLACLVVVNRPGTDPVDFAVLAGVTSPQRRMLFEQHTVEMPLIGLSSTEIRSRIAAGKSVRYQTPRAVEAYIDAKNLYQQNGSK
jgi:nicotinate-nucleotide adenylyltransferase